MNRTRSLIVSTTLMMITGGLYADSNPYTFFGTGNASQGSSAVTVSNVGTNTPASTVTASAPAVTATSSPNIQYVQPANPVGKLGSTQQQQPLPLAATTNSTYPQGSLQSPMTSSPPNLNNSLQAGLLGDTGSSTTIDLGTTNNLLQTIATNTTNIQSYTNNLGALYDYWTHNYSSDSFIPTTTGYNAAVGIIAAETTQTSNKNNYTSLPNLKGTFTADKDGHYVTQNAVPFLANITDETAGEPQYKYWGPSVENALIDISNSQTQMDNLQQAVNAPFQSGWIDNVKTASNPQLLRTIAVEQAVQNALLYKMLQQQQDAMLMQASELRMLREVISSGQSQVTQQKRVVRALEEQAGHGGGL